MRIDAPLDVYRDVVRPEWIDHNGHMNMGYYLVVFDLATDEFMRWVGLGAEHRGARRVTTFCLESHVTYHREVRAGDALRFTTQLLAHDAKRLHYFHAMSHAIARTSTSRFARRLWSRRASASSSIDATSGLRPPP